MKDVVCGVNWLTFRNETVSGHCEAGADFLRVLQMHFLLLGRAMSQTVCRWLFAAETQVRSRASEICGTQSGTETHSTNATYILGRAMSQTVCCWLFAAETRVRSRASEICGTQSGTETYSTNATFSFSC
jgi:3-deoxy-D-arabino-heptulosonate 7-phosphate (DAHP) synthase